MHLQSAELLFFIDSSSLVSAMSYADPFGWKVRTDDSSFASALCYEASVLNRIGSCTGWENSYLLYLLLSPSYTVFFVLVRFNFEKYAFAFILLLITVIIYAFSFLYCKFRPKNRLLAVREKSIIRHHLIKFQERFGSNPFHHSLFLVWVWHVPATSIRKLHRSKLSEKDVLNLDISHLPKVLFLGLVLISEPII